MSPAHHSRERRWLVLALVVLVVAGVAVAAGTAGRRRRSAAPAAPSALVGAPDAESSAWYCTGSRPRRAVAPGFLVLTNTTARAGDGAPSPR